MSNNNVETSVSRTQLSVEDLLVEDILLVEDLYIAKTRGRGGGLSKS
jgi:hypothetical protein